MPIGYSHGKQYVVDKRYDRYAEMPVFREIVKVGMKAGYGAHIYFSHITRNYCCEVRKLNQRFQGSGNVYWVTAGHKYADTPLEALTLAFRECVPHTPYLAALYLEANWSLLVEAIRLHQRLDRALDDLTSVLELCRSVPDLQNVFIEHDGFSEMIITGDSDGIDLDEMMEDMGWFNNLTLDDDL